MRIFVTGGTGFIGSRVVARLCAAGHSVTCLVRSPQRAGRLSQPPVEIVTGDLADHAALAQGLADADACIHLASVSAWAQIAGPHVETTIIDGTRNLLQAARARPRLRLIHVSSVAAVNGADRPITFDESSRFELASSGLRYAVAKHAAEQLVRTAAASGLNASIVNPGETYGSGDLDFVTAGPIRDQLRSRSPVFVLAGGISVTHIDDVAHGILQALALGRAGERYILGGDNLTLRAVAQLTLELAGRRKPIVTLSPGLVAAVAHGCQAAGLTPPLAPALIGYARRYWFVSSAKAERELGYRTRPARAVFEPLIAWLSAIDAAPVTPRGSSPGSA